MKFSKGLIITAAILLAAILFYFFGEDNMVETVIDYILLVMDFLENETPHAV